MVQLTKFQGQYFWFYRKALFVPISFSILSVCNGYLFHIVMITKWPYLFLGSAINHNTERLLWLQDDLYVFEGMLVFQVA